MWAQPRLESVMSQVSFSLISVVNPIKNYTVSENISQKIGLLYTFYSLTSIYLNSKLHCCNGTFTNVIFANGAGYL